jgi:hypothetical protein
MHEVKFSNPKVGERVAAWKSGNASFDLSHCDLTSDDLEQLGCDEVVTSRVMYVFMPGNPAEKWIEGVHALARFKRFKGASFKDCDLGKVKDVGRRLGDGLKRCAPFVGLTLTLNALHAEQLAPLFERLPFLGSTDLCGNDFDDLTGLAEAMRPLYKLYGLKIGFNPFECIAPLVLAGVLRNVGQLYLWECENLSDAESLAPLAWDTGGHLQFVDLRGCSAWEERLSSQPLLLHAGGLNSAGQPLLGILT